jgi:site-specific DNA recombinase
MKIMEDRQPRAAIYARVSSDHQAREGTIASQVADLKERVAQDGLTLSDELTFLDEGHSGSTLIRPALERLRDAAYSGGIDRLYVHSPDRLARKYAYQALLVEELNQHGVELVFLNQAMGKTPEEEMLLQMQGMMAEYERAKIMERTRRGRRYAARRGSVNALCTAPYGYRYVTKQEGGGEARYQVVLEQAQVVVQMFEWVAQERLSIRDVSRRLTERKIPTRTGLSRWHEGTVGEMLTNAAYKGLAVFGKTRVGPRKPALRPHRGCVTSGQSHSVYRTTPEEQERIPVPGLVSEELFDAVQQQLTENRLRKRHAKSGPRHLLQGLVVCAGCRYACGGRRVRQTNPNGKEYRYAYYRCTGSEPDPFGGKRICQNKAVRADLLEQAVWDDVKTLVT